MLLLQGLEFSLHPITLRPAPTGTVPPEWGGMVNLKRVQIQDLPLVYGALRYSLSFMIITLDVALQRLALWSGSINCLLTLVAGPGVAARFSKLCDDTLPCVLPSKLCLRSDVTLARRQHPRELVISKAGGLPLPEQQHVWCAVRVILQSSQKHVCMLCGMTFLSPGKQIMAGFRHHTVYHKAVSVREKARCKFTVGEKSPNYSVNTRLHEPMRTSVYALCPGCLPVAFGDSPRLMSLDMSWNSFTGECRCSAAN